MRSAAMKLHLAAMDGNRRASCRSSLPFLLLSSFVLSATSLPLHSSVPISFRISLKCLGSASTSTPCCFHSMILPSITTDLSSAISGPKIVLTLALYLSQMAFLRSFKCVPGPLTTKSSP